MTKASNISSILYGKLLKKLENSLIMKSSEIAFFSNWVTKKLHLKVPIFKLFLDILKFVLQSIF